MNALDDFADASFDAGLLTEVGNVFSSFAYDDAGLLCTNERAQSQGILGRGRG